jgi:hypothetical protein
LPDPLGPISPMRSLARSAAPNCPRSSSCRSRGTPHRTRPGSRPRLYTRIAGNQQPAAGAPARPGLHSPGHVRGPRSHHPRSPAPRHPPAPRPHRPASTSRATPSTTRASTPHSSPASTRATPASPRSTSATSGVTSRSTTAPCAPPPCSAATTAARSSASTTAASSPSTPRPCGTTATACAPAPRATQRPPPVRPPLKHRDDGPDRLDRRHHRSPDPPDRPRALPDQAPFMTHAPRSGSVAPCIA